MSKKISPTLRGMTKKQRVLLGVLALLLALACFLLETTGAMDGLLRLTGVMDNASLPPTGVLEAHVLDVGDADAIFVVCDGTTLLIDAGEKAAGDTVIAYLMRLGVNRLDYVIATHADADHIGGMRQVVETFSIGTFLTALMPKGQEPNTTTYLNLLTVLKEKHVAVTEAVPGASYNLGAATLSVLGPLGLPQDENENSVVCRITHGEKQFLFTGDAGVEAEQQLLEGGVDLKSSFLKVGHHGSDTSSSTRFLRAVSPEIAVISCGADNEYGHPHSEILARLRNIGAQVYRTDVNGTVIVSSDGYAITVETDKE